MLYIFLFLFFIGCFILGMTWLRVGLFNLSSHKIKTWISRLTSTPFRGLLVGTGITGILQSSSAVMVLTVGLVSAKVLTFPQTIGIILGTNIGTTFTLELITFNIDIFIIPLFILGIILLFLRHPMFNSLSYIFIGIALVFSSMNAFEWLTKPMQKIASISNVLQLVDHHVLSAVLFGVIITAIIQSSTAMTGIAMGFLASGVITLDTGIAIMLGANIGTCITAYLATIGAGNEAKLTAYAHIWLNVLGVMTFLPFIPKLSNLAISLTSSPQTQLAHASVVFNVLCSVGVLPFANLFAKFILKIHGKSHPPSTFTN
ncbi:phosphate:Na+ symporter [Oikeobacillus pervagus]|uniref:Phosphate:Na+ symporter n=1 Tax=Oikeobacillus pervagus TaxID=1325931 RepID=A0AAJ1SY80_9BACI|nr:Na/Pi symporter [Oikeobacillus pervagus]MDQ0213927.1 phosphate:Na+ symporter [Oikeobacillus pervagus]